ncbi:MAG: OmpA family protein [Microscillaceae bacterium]|nr:OmpA family protein [Microscillaceae bacterium]
MLAQNASGVYVFENNLQESNQSLPALTVLGTPGIFETEELPELGIRKKVYVFEQNCGFSFNDAATRIFKGSYSIELYFKFTDLQSWRRVIDFKNRKTDRGAYIFSGQLNFYNFINSDIAPIVANEYSHYILTRDAQTQILSIYADGEAKVSFVDNGQEALTDQDNVINFFFDDLAVQNEASAGAVAYLKIYDYVIDPAAAREFFTLLKTSIEEGVDNQNRESLPKLAETLKRDKKLIIYGINFEYNADQIKPSSESTLQNIAGLLKTQPNLRLRIEGHTDNTGEEGSNQQLSERRAQSVKRHLVSQLGIAENRLEAVGKGEKNPIADNSTEAGRSKNRRVEFTVLE